MKYTVLEPVKIAGKRYAPGETVELSKKAAGDIPSGTIAEPEVVQTAEQLKALADADAKRQKDEADAKAEVERKAKEDADKLAQGGSGS